MDISARKNLKNLWWLRNLAIAGQAVAILVVIHVLHIPLAARPLWVIILALAIVNILTLWRLKSAISEAELLAQLLVDVAALFGLLYFTGGAANPFATLFILQVIIAAVVLKPAYTWLVAGITIGLYTLLLFWRVEVPYFSHHSEGEFFNLHIEGMWLSFVMLAGIVAWFVVRMNNTIRKQNAQLADAEKLAAIGTLAAAAAHELATPLATLSVLAEDGAMPLFKEQLARCKQILSRITAAGGVARAESGTAVEAADFLDAILQRWQADRPGAALEVALQEGESPRIFGDYALEQALRNLLDNAADASPQEVRFAAEWTAEELMINITDEGGGVTAEIEESASTKGGLGLGLFLARNIIQRLGGEFQLRQAPGGISALVILPLKRLAL